MENVADILTEGARRWPDHSAAADSSCQLCYTELLCKAKQIAGWLISHGVAPGDRVIVRLPNSVRFVEAHFGALLAGAVSTPLDPALPESQLEDIRRRTEPTAELSSDSPWEAIECAKPLDESVVRQPQDLAALMFTTGTTGQPKGVMLTHANVLTALRNIVEFIGYTEHDREVITLPLSHNFGLGHVYCNLMCGGAVYLEPGLTRIGRVLKAIKEFGATGFPTTPLGVAMLLDRYGDAFREHARGLRFMVVNSAPLPPERAAQLQAALPDLNILVYYGLTEASRSTFISLTNEGPKRYSSVGRAMPGVGLRLSEAGEILLGGSTVTPGYWRDVKMTNSVLQGGLLHTGDLGRIDEQGFVFIEGRADDIINLGGYKINPLTVERAVETFPGVRECAVAGEDEVCAFYVAEAKLDADQLTRHCRKSLSVRETPTRFTRVDSLPRTESGKLKRRALWLAQPPSNAQD